MNSRGGGFGKLYSSCISIYVLAANILLAVYLLLIFFGIPFFNGMALMGLILLLIRVIYIPGLLEGEVFYPVLYLKIDF